jgi:prevent-host-death family protein
MLIPTNQNIKTITDMRENALELLEEVKNQGLLYVFQHSNPKAVLLSMEEFERLYGLLEDHLDEMEAVKLSRGKRGKGIPLAAILKKYSK